MLLSSLSASPMPQILGLPASGSLKITHLLINKQTNYWVAGRECVCDCVGVCMFVWVCVCLCVCMRRKRERERDGIRVKATMISLK